MCPTEVCFQVLTTYWCLPFSPSFLSTERLTTSVLPLSVSSSCCPPRITRLASWTSTLQFVFLQLESAELRIPGESVFLRIGILNNQQDRSEHFPVCFHLLFFFQVIMFHSFEASPFYVFYFGKWAKGRGTYWVYALSNTMGRVVLLAWGLQYQLCLWLPLTITHETAFCTSQGWEYYGYGVKHRFVQMKWSRSKEPL